MVLIPNINRETYALLKERLMNIGANSRRRFFHRRNWIAVPAAAVLFVAACTGTSADEAGTDADDGADSASGVPSVVVTMGIWADVASNVGCEDSVSITTIIPPGGDPHTFEPSLRDRETMDDADLVIANGLGLEESLHDTLEAVAEAGTPIFELGDHIETIEFDIAAAHGHGHGEAEDDGHDDEDEAEEGEGHDEDDSGEGHAEEEEAGHDEDEGEDDGHDESEGEDDGHDEDEGEDDGHDEGEGEDDHHEEGGADPHIWFDLQKVANALPALADALIGAGADADLVRGCLESYRQAMVDADAQMLEIISAIPDERRILVTNHDSLGYFADRYGFEVIGTVIPANTTAAEANPAELADLAEIIEHEGVPAVFSETTSADDDAQALATAAGNVAVVPLLTGSLAPAGETGDTLIGLLLHNAQAIADALNADG